MRIIMKGISNENVIKRGCIMKNTYPIIISPGVEYMVVSIPDFNINTQGKDITEAIEMARDAIGIVGIDMEDEGEELPTPTELNLINRDNIEDIVTLVDVDFDKYRMMNAIKSIRKNCTIPSWLNFEAEKAGINFSAVLQSALKQELGLYEYEKN